MTRRLAQVAIAVCLAQLLFSVSTRGEGSSATPTEQRIKQLEEGRRAAVFNSDQMTLERIYAEGMTTVDIDGNLHTNTGKRAARLNTPGTRSPRSVLTTLRHSLPDWRSRRVSFGVPEDTGACPMAPRSRTRTAENPHRSGRIGRTAREHVGKRDVRAVPLHVGPVNPLRGVFALAKRMAPRRGIEPTTRGLTRGAAAERIRCVSRRPSDLDLGTERKSGTRKRALRAPDLNLRLWRPWRFESGPAV